MVCVWNWTQSSCEWDLFSFETVSDSSTPKGATWCHLKQHSLPPNEAFYPRWLQSWLCEMFSFNRKQLSQNTGLSICELWLFAKVSNIQMQDIHTLKKLANSTLSPITEGEGNIKKSGKSTSGAGIMIQCKPQPASKAISGTKIYHLCGINPELFYKQFCYAYWWNRIQMRCVMHCDA